MAFQYTKLIWQCNEKQRGQHCKTPHLTDADIQYAFLIAFNMRLEGREEILAAYQEIANIIGDTSELDTEKVFLQNESEVVVELIRKAIEDNAHKAIDQGEYEKRYNALCSRYETARKRLLEIEDIRLERRAKKTKIALFLEELEKQENLVTEYDEELWYTTVDFVTVYEDGRLVFTFRDGNEVEVNGYKKKSIL